jgi:hypothetical protein
MSSWNNEVINNIDEINNLSFRFSINERFVYAKNSNNKYFQFQSPFLKVLKPVHVIYNKKKSISKKYLILETLEDIDFNNQINDFIYMINKVHEISQERIKEKSLAWFNTEFDEIGLDLKIRRPIEQNNNSEFIKISIPLDNSELEEKILKLSKGEYVLCDLLFKGLKVSSDFILEDIEIINFMTQKEYDDIQNNDFINDSIFLNNEIIENIEEHIEEHIENNTESLPKKDLPVSNGNETLENKEIIESKEVENCEVNNKHTVILDNIPVIVDIISEKVSVESIKVENIEIKNKKVLINKKYKENKEINNQKNNQKNNIKKKNELIKKISKKLIFT